MTPFYEELLQILTKQLEGCGIRPMWVLTALKPVIDKYIDDLLKEHTCSYCSEE
jgi:hypothetical protein